MDGLAALLGFSKNEGLALSILGSGSNILASGKPLDMVAVSLKRGFTRIDFNQAETRIYADAGVDMQTFIIKMLGEGYSGLEFMAGIPGTLGGALMMNAGSGQKGPWILDFVKAVRVLDSSGREGYLEKKDLRYGYRYSGLEDFIILGADFDLKVTQDKPSLRMAYDNFLYLKKERQELSAPSAGCVFRNPNVEHSAAKLIEGCGLKGKRLGGAMISEKHANFIINTGTAGFEDVAGLIELAKQEVARKYNINLETEIEILR